MVPTLLLMERIATLIGSDTLTLGSTDALQFHLAKNAFTEGPAITFGDLIEADFDGYTSHAGTGTAAPESMDPATGNILLDLVFAAGLDRWETTGMSNLPQTIYGVFVTNENGDVLYGCKRFPTSVQLTNVNQSLVAPRQTLTFLNNGIV